MTALGDFHVFLQGAVLAAVAGLSCFGIGWFVGRAFAYREQEEGSAVVELNVPGLTELIQELRSILVRLEALKGDEICGD